MKKIRNILLSTLLITATLFNTTVFATTSSDSFKQVIPYTYDVASPFSEGYAYVEYGDKKGYINTKGKLKIKTDDYSSGGLFSEGLAIVENGTKKGFINTKGELIVPCEYDKAYKFENGFAVVSKDSLYGFIDKEGNALTPIKYEFAAPFDADGQALVSENKVYKLIDSTGNTVIEYPYSVVYPFSENYAAFLGDTGYGYMDKSGTPIVASQYDAAMFYADGLAPTFMYPIWSFVDEKGNEVATGFDSVDIFREGLAKVQKMGGMGYIDTTGKIVFTVNYQYSKPFSYGLSAIKKDGKGGFVDKTGELAIPLVFIEVDSFSDGYAAVYNGQKWGYITSKLAVPYGAETTTTPQASEKDYMIYVMISMFVIPVIAAFFAALSFKKRGARR